MANGFQQTHEEAFAMTQDEFTMAQDVLEVTITDADLPQIDIFGRAVLDLILEVGIKPDAAIVVLSEIIDMMVKQKEGYRGVTH